MKDLAKYLASLSLTRIVAIAAAAVLVLLASAISKDHIDSARAARLESSSSAGARLATPNPKLKIKPIRTFVCLSSWYGADFDGQLTADGEIYDMYGQTAAHPTLPLGSVVRVMNLSTRRSAIVRINDRGPYVPGRDLDVSYQVARELGFARRGTARVRVELLKVPSSKATPPAN